MLVLVSTCRNANIRVVVYGRNRVRTRDSYRLFGASIAGAVNSDCDNYGQNILHHSAERGLRHGRSCVEWIFTKLSPSLVKCLLQAKTLGGGWGFNMTPYQVGYAEGQG